MPWRGALVVELLVGSFLFHLRRAVSPVAVCLGLSGKLSSYPFAVFHAAHFRGIETVPFGRQEQLSKVTNFRGEAS